jgi:hypothetical protein
MRSKKLLLVLVTFTFFVSLQAKRYNPYGSDWAFGFHFGGTSFFGDLRAESGGLNSTPFSKYFYEDMRPMGGIVIDKWFNAYIGITGNMQFGRLQGTKASSSAYFIANIFEYNLSANVNLSNIIFGADRRRHFLIYSTLGIGMTESRTLKYQIGTEKQIGSNGFGKPKTEGGKYISMTETILPMALGMKIFVGNNLSINLEGSVHLINSDKLDATANDNTSYIAGIEGYTYYSIGLQYWFGFNGYHISNHYNQRSRYNGGRSGYVQINPRKTGRKNNHFYNKSRKRFKFTRI